MVEALLFRLGRLAGFRNLWSNHGSRIGANRYLAEPTFSPDDSRVSHDFSSTQAATPEVTQVV
jgi:hypothetical protein